MLNLVNIQIEMFQIVAKQLPGMCARQTIRGTIIAMYLELLYAIHALQGAEALQRYLRGASDKL